MMDHTHASTNFQAGRSIAAVLPCVCCTTLHAFLIARIRILNLTDTKTIFSFAGGLTAFFHFLFVLEICLIQFKSDCSMHNPSEHLR